MDVQSNQNTVHHHLLNMPELPVTVLLVRVNVLDRVPDGSAMICAVICEGAIGGGQV